MGGRAQLYVAGRQAYHTPCRTRAPILPARRPGGVRICLDRLACPLYIQQDRFYCERPGCAALLELRCSWSSLGARAWAASGRRQWHRATNSSHALNDVLRSHIPLLVRCIGCAQISLLDLVVAGRLSAITSPRSKILHLNDMIGILTMYPVSSRSFSVIHVWVHEFCGVGARRDAGLMLIVPGSAYIMTHLISRACASSTKVLTWVRSTAA